MKSGTGAAPALVVALLSLAACGASPTRPVDPVAASPAPDVPTTAGTPRDVASSPVTEPTPQSARKVPAGYRVVKRNGKELYCRSVTTIGTRFAEEMCFTREQIDEIESRTDHAMDDFEQARKTCAGGDHCGG